MSRHTYKLINVLYETRITYRAFCIIASFTTCMVMIYANDEYLTDLIHLMIIISGVVIFGIMVSSEMETYDKYNSVKETKKRTKTLIKEILIYCPATIIALKVGNEIYIKIYDKSIFDDTLFLALTSTTASIGSGICIVLGILAITTTDQSFESYVFTQFKNQKQEIKGI